MGKISVVLPARNEGEMLPGLLKRIAAILGPGVEIIVVDDASTDNTPAVAGDCGAKVIKNPYNMGNGASVKRGIREACGDIVVLMDADGQHQPEEIPKLLQDINDFDMVVGSRFRASQGFFRGVANSIYNMLASYVTDVGISDLTSGFRAFKRDKALKFLYLFPNGFSYPTTLTLSFIKASYPVKFVPVKTLPRQKGASKISVFKDGSRFFLIIIKIAVFFAPLKVFLPVSLLFFLTGISYYCYTFLRFHRFTNMGMFLFTGSVIIFMLGLISEQIASLKMEKSGN